MDEKELQALFKAISAKFDVGDYNTFKSKMQTSDDRKRFYDVVATKGFDLGDYNEYETRLAGSKKKGLGLVGASAISSVSPSNGRLKSEKPIDFNTKENLEGFQKALRENQILPEVVTDRDAQEAAAKQITDVSQTIKSDSKDPLGEILNHTVNYKTPDSKAQLKVFTQKMKMLNEQAFPSTEQAENWLNSHAQQNNGVIDPNNFTASLAKNVIDDKKKVTDAINNHFSGNLDLAAIDYFGGKDDEMGKKIRDMNGNVPDVLKGHLLMDLLNTKGAKEWAAESQQNEAIYNDKKNHILDDYPDIRKQDILQKIAQGREDLGYNNPILNLVGKKSSDAIVNTLLATGKLTEKDKKFYESFIRPTIAIEGIPTPGLIESVLNTGAEAITDVPKSIADLTGLSSITDNKAERVYEDTKKEYTGVNVTFKGKNAFAHAVGDLAGIVLPIGGEAKMLQGLNLIKDANTANRLMQGLTFYHQLYKQNLKDMPDNDVGAHFAALLQVYTFDRINKVLPGLAKDVTDEIRPTLKSVMERLATNKITGAAAAQEITESVMGKLGSVGKTAGTAAAKTVELAGQMGLATEINGTISDIFSGKNHAEQNVQNAVKTFETMMLGSYPLSLIAARGANKQMTAEMLNHIAEHPDTYAEHVKLLAQTDKDFAKIAPEITENLKHLTDVHAELAKRDDLSPEQKTKTQLLSLSKRIIENKIEKSPDKVLNGKDEKDLKSIEIEQKKVLDPEMGNKKFIEEMYDEDLLPKGSKELLEDEKGKFSEHKVGDYLKFIAQQANGLDENWNPLEGKAPSMDKIPEQVVELANERWAKEIEGAKPKLKSTSVIMPGENKAPDVIPLKKGEVRTPEGIATPIEDKKIVSENEWHRGVNKNNQDSGDRFYSTDEGVAHDYAINKVGEEPNMTKLSKDEHPKNPLIVGSKEDLAATIGFPEENIYDLNGNFDKKAKEYAQSKGHDAIVYESGSMDNPEMHIFEKPKANEQATTQPKDIQQPEQINPEVTKLEAERDAKIEEVSKPDMKMDFVPAQDLVNSKDPIRNREIQNDIKDRFKKLKELIDCLHDRK